MRQTLFGISETIEWFDTQYQSYYVFQAFSGQRSLLSEWIQSVVDAKWQSLIVEAADANVLDGGRVEARKKNIRLLLNVIDPLPSPPSVITVVVDIRRPRILRSLLSWGTSKNFE